jgi:L-amino acid N-acyltransferase YncA
MVGFVIRPARIEDAHPMAELISRVAEERDGIATEPPVDVEERAAVFARGTSSTLVAESDDQVIGMLHIEASRFGSGEFGMAVARDCRGRGVGAALVAAAIEWARAEGLHKLCLEVFPHNQAALGLYRKFDFVEEGRRVKQIRRANGELWDSIVMGLLL